MNISHPYGYPVALALLSIAAFFLVVTYREVDQLIEDRRQRRLEATANEEIRKQVVDHAEGP